MSIYVLSIFRNLFPDTIYKNEFGGHPFKIPDLDNQQVKEFHKTHYHPSNSKFYTYGNQKLEFYLSKIDKILQKFDRNDNYKLLSHIDSQIKWDHGRELLIRCPPDLFNKNLDNQITTSISFLLVDIQNYYENFVLNIISNLLVNGQNSPFYESLINSGLGSDYSPGTGYESSTKQSLFSIGLQGVKEDDIPKIKQIINNTLHQVKDNGFPKERIDAILHSIELSSKHHTSSFGLNLINLLNSTWNHDGDVIETLNLNKNVERFKKDLNDNPKFLQEKIDQYFIKNQHQLTLTMKPSPTYLDEFKENLNKTRDSKIDQLNEEKKKILIKDCLELNKRMNLKDNVEVLPCLSVDNDIDKELPQPTNIEKIKLLDNNSVQIAAQNTNQLIYFRALSKINLNELNDDLLPYLSIFCSLLTELGAGNLDRKQMSQEIELNTSGLNTSVHVKSDLITGEQCELYVLLNSYCLEEKLDKMLDLWSKFFNDLKLDGDEQHIHQLIKMNAVNLSQEIVYSGHMFSALRSSHSINPVNNIKEHLSGIEYINKLNEISENVDIKIVIDKLKQIAKIVFKRENLRLALNAEPNKVSSSLKSYENFLNNLKSNQFNHENGLNILNNFKSKTNLHEHYILPFNSNYVSKSFLGVPFNHTDYAKYQLVTKLLSRKYLHNEIREKGSAYGSGLKMDLNGVLSFYSYRDPNLQNTLNVFDKSFEWLSNESNYTDQDINEAKLNLFKDIDKPITAGNHGISEFLNGINDQMISNYRKNVFNIKKGDIVNLVLKDLNKFNQNIGVACLGPKNKESESSKWNHLNDK